MLRACYEGPAVSPIESGDKRFYGLAPSQKKSGIPTFERFVRLDSVEAGAIGAPVVAVETEVVLLQADHSSAA